MEGMTPTDWTTLMDSMGEGMSFEELVRESTTQRTRRAISKLCGVEVFDAELVRRTLSEATIFGEHSDHFFAIATGQHDLLDKLTGENRIKTVVDSISDNSELKVSIGILKRRFI